MARRSGRGPLAMSATGIPRHAPALSMAALVGLAALLTAAQLSLSAGIPRLVLTLLMWAVYVGGACAVGLLPSRQALWLAVGGGAALQALAIRVRPWTTDDFRRYAWDGRVQAAGIDPYRYAPQDPQLAFLRDPWLFPDGVHTALNHPLAHTIYPPFAQGYFWLVEVLPGGPGRGFALQLSFALVAVATSVAIVAALRGAGADVRRVVWWSWCPTVVMEAGGNAHIDVLAALLAVGFVVALTRERWSRAGVFLGLAVATKFLPLLLAVAIPPRRTARVLAIAGGLVALLYLPHLIVLRGQGVSGYLGGYVAEESRDRWDLLRPFLPDAALPVVGMALLAGAAAWLWWRGPAFDRTLAGAASRAAALTGTMFLLVTVPYPWYFTPLVGLVALGAPRVWLLVAVAAYPVYAAADLGHAYFGTRFVGYGLAAVIVAIVLTRRERRRQQRQSAPGALGTAG